MSRRRRILCLVTGVLVILFSLMLGWIGLFLSSRVGNPYSVETAIQLIEDMKGQGAVFADEDEIRGLLFDVIYNEIQRAAGVQASGFEMMAVLGLFAIVFALWPSRKKNPVAMLDTAECVTDDWRLQNQESYLLNAHLVWCSYKKPSQEWDHDHCEFCGVKFMEASDATGEDILHEGYQTLDENGHWICKQCYQNFSGQFMFRVVDSSK